MVMMSTSTVLTKVAKVLGTKKGPRLRRNARMESLTPLLDSLRCQSKKSAEKPFSKLLLLVARSQTTQHSMIKKAVQQGRRECGPRSVLIEREETERLRTKLADFFSILLTPIRH